MSRDICQHVLKPDTVTTFVVTTLVDASVHDLAGK